jgi:glucokinase
VDIGATKLRVAFGNQEGIISKLIEDTDKNHGPLGISAQIIRMIHKFRTESVDSIGIGSIGPIDISNGAIIGTPNLPFQEIPLTQPLRDEFKVPIGLLNDCTAAVLGEYHFGAGIGTENLAYITLSTGIGGGAIIDGHLLIGKNGNAVEVGHITIDPTSCLICSCGSPGHWEAYASGNNIPKYLKTVIIDEFWDSVLSDITEGEIDRVNTKNLFEAANKGDKIALRFLEELGKINAVGFANVVNAYDPELITVGGSIALYNPNLILEPIKKYIDKHLLNKKPRIIITPLGDEIVLYGALSKSMKILNE